MTKAAENTRVRRSRLRFVAMLVAGTATFLYTGMTGSWVDAPAVGWATAALIYVAWVWLVIARMDPAETEQHATSEDPSRGVTDLLILYREPGQYCRSGGSDRQLPH